jgi:hypothetical protein
MQGLMMDTPLLITEIMRFAAGRTRRMSPWSP